MPLPTSVTQVTITGDILHPVTGNPAVGTVTFTMPQGLRTNDGHLIGTDPIIVTLVNGAVPAGTQLAATDNANITPQGWVYTVTINTDAYTSTFQAALPSNPSSVALSSLVPALTPPAVATYVPLSSVGQAGGVAPLDAAARLPVANLTVGGYDTRYVQSTPARNAIWGRPIVVTHFQSGHGWGIANTGAFNLNDTTDGIHGTQVVTATTVGNTATYAILDKTGNPAVDTTGKMIRVWVKLDNPNTINNINLRCAPTGGLAANSYFSWDLVLAPYYAGQYLTPAGQWVCLGLSFADSYTVGTPARTAITEWRFVFNDTGAASTVHFGGIEIYNAAPPKYPNGVVTLCFDDSYAGHYTIARTVLGQYGYQATMFPIVDVVGTSGYMTVTQMRALQDLMGWEVAPHAYTAANHANFASLTAAQIQADLASSINWMQANGFRRAGSYAYPLGVFSGGQDAVVSPYVELGRTIQSTLFNETLPVGNPLRLRGASGVGGLGGLSVSGSITNAGGILDGCKAQASWCILTMHDVSTGASTGINQISQADLQTLVSGINTRGIAVATMSEVIRSGAFGI